MTEDESAERPGREDGEPDPAIGLSGAALWSGFLDNAREQIVAGVLSLSPVEQRRTRVPSGWTPIELLSHVLHMEQRWFVWGFLGETVADPWGDWNIEEPWDDDANGRWLVAEDVTAESLVEQLRAIGERTRGVLASYPLDTLAASGGRFAENPPSLEWICFHVLAEYARHAGHLDIVVELAR